METKMDCYLLELRRKGVLFNFRNINYEFNYSTLCTLISQIHDYDRLCSERRDFSFI